MRPRLLTAVHNWGVIPQGPSEDPCKIQPEDGSLGINSPNPSGWGCHWPINFPVGPGCSVFGLSVVSEKVLW